MLWYTGPVSHSLLYYRFFCRARGFQFQDDARHSQRLANPNEFILVECRSGNMAAGALCHNLRARNVYTCDIGN